MTQTQSLLSPLTEMFWLCSVAVCSSPPIDSQLRSMTSLLDWLKRPWYDAWAFRCVHVCAFVSVCTCGSMQRLIHNDDRKYSIMSSHSVIFTKQQGGESAAEGKRWERGGVAVDWKRWRQSKTTETDRDGKRKMKHRRRDEMSMLIHLYHKCVFRNNEHIYNVPVILHRQLQYIYYLSFLPVC